LEQKPKQEKVRIAYYGDSMVDGDLIVQDIRRKLQDKYGGYGVGFVPITSESASTRASVKHSYSSNWESYSFLKKSEEALPYGINGSVYYAQDTVENSSVIYDMGVYPANHRLPSPVLFYGQSENQSGTVKVEA